MSSNMFHPGGQARTPFPLSFSPQSSIGNCRHPSVCTYQHPPPLPGFCTHLPAALPGPTLNGLVLLLHRSQDDFKALEHVD